jgi:hypothetical protein
MLNILVCMKEAILYGFLSFCMGCRVVFMPTLCMVECREVTEVSE